MRRADRTPRQSRLIRPQRSSTSGYLALSVRPLQCTQRGMGLRAMMQAGVSMDEAIQVVTTTDQEQTAQAIAQDLVAQRLAACVHIGGPITSVYRWQGEVETAFEWTCAIKTLRRLYPAVESRIRQLHNYEVPEIVVLPLVDGSPDYLTWLRAQVRESSS